MPIKRAKSPLLINIFWDIGSKDLYSYADILYSYFLRDMDNPLDRYLNIPVRLYPYIPTFKELDFGDEQYSANVFLVDDRMVVSKEWKDFMLKMLETVKKVSEEKHSLLPVGYTKNAFKIPDAVKKINYIDLTKIQKVRRERHLLISLSHAITRLISKKEKDAQTGEKIKLFISHAQKDGEALAEALRDYIRSFTQIATFFDANDIAYGPSFPEELKSKIHHSLLLVLHTDKYSTREWCRWELLMAKQHNRPIIVINQYKAGEIRSFPYMGNIPHIHLPIPEKENELRAYSPTFLDRIILEAIREALRNQYHTMQIETLLTVFNQPNVSIVSYPPEVITLQNLKKSAKTILYPDPPLGGTELNLLQSFRPDLQFITPTLLPLYAQNIRKNAGLNKLKIAISLSETNYGTTTWIQNKAIQDLMVSIARYLLVAGANLIYSGDIKYHKKEEGKFNFSLLLSDLVQNYRNTYGDSNKIYPIDCYSFYPKRDLLTVKDEAKYLEQINFIKAPYPKGLNVGKAQAADIDLYDTFDKKYVWAKSLTIMRETMIEAAAAVIILGGKCIGFKGKMPGVLEEVLIAMEQNKPIFLIGGFGGVSQCIAEALQGNQPIPLQLLFFDELYPAYGEFIRQFNAERLTITEEKKGKKIQVDYQAIIQSLNKRGKSTYFGLNNGLTKKENKRLFETRDEIEILSLLFKGLNTLPIV